MKKTAVSWAMAAAGLILLAAGLYMIKAFTDPQGALRALPYVCVGLGCGVFGHGMGNILSNRAIRNSPEMQKRLQVIQNDERNIAVTNRAKAKAYDMMTFVFGALMLAFALMGLDVAAVLLLVFAYLFVHGYAIYCRVQYEKVM